MNLITFLSDVALVDEQYICNYKPDGEIVFNLEYVLTNDNSNPAKNKVNLNKEAVEFKKFFGKNPIAASLANNHVMDYGDRGFNETINTLEKQGIKYFGAGSKENNYNNPLILKDKNVGLISYNLIKDPFNNYNNSFANFSQESFIEEVGKLRGKKIKNIVVNIHWGIEESPMHNSTQEEIGRFLVDNGADLVIGHHPHCIQPFEKYKEKYIFYSIGNCVFPNHSCDSFYDKDSAPKRRFNKRLPKHNRKSYAITYDIDLKKVHSIEQLYFNERKLYKVKNVNINKKTIILPNKVNKFVTQYRKYKTFLISNFFREGKFFELNALRHEIKMKYNKR